MIRKVLIGAALLTLAACEKKEETTTTTAENTATTATATTTTTPAAAVATTTAIDLETVPTEEEFEEEAEKEITPANFEKKLDDLEKEISAE